MMKSHTRLLFLYVFVMVACTGLWIMPSYGETRRDKADALYEEGRKLYYDESDYSGAKDQWDKALEIYIELEHYINAAIVLEELASMTEGAYEYEDTLNYCLQLLQIYKDLTD